MGAATQLKRTKPPIEHIMSVMGLLLEQFIIWCLCNATACFQHARSTSTSHFLKFPSSHDFVEATRFRELPFSKELGQLSDEDLEHNNR
jgi:hypothetical protein